MNSYPDAPVVGLKYQVNEDEVIVPTYVRISETPAADGSCNTANWASDEPLKAAGWYVEFHYPQSPDQYRRFIKFDRTPRYEFDSFDEQA